MRSLDEELTDLADHYRWFAEVEAAPVSPRYAQLAAAVAADDDVLAFLGTLPTPKRQANLLLGALQFLHGGPPADGAQLRDRVLGDADRAAGDDARPRDPDQRGRPLRRLLPL
ncbi:hypothetical protein A7K94_0209655, partial [Modestobacter sp. VKM Ac-2676]